jgi:hypothetical protein
MMNPEPHPYDPDDPTDYDETAEDLAYLVPNRGFRRDETGLDDYPGY